MINWNCYHWNHLHFVPNMYLCIFKKILQCKWSFSASSSLYCGSLWKSKHVIIWTNITLVIVINYDESLTNYIRYIIRNLRLLLYLQTDLYETGKIFIFKSNIFVRTHHSFVIQRYFLMLYHWQWQFL